MNPRPDFSQMSGFGAPAPQPSGLARFLPQLRGLAAGSAAATAGLFVLQLALPDGWRPSDILGKAAGSTERHEIEEKSAIKLTYERALADAVAQAQAKAQADMAAINATLAQRTQSLQTQSSIAGLADAFCYGSQAIAMLGSNNTGADVHDGARAVAQSSCGLGNEIRADITRSQLDVVRETARDRGAPINDGAARPNTTEVYAPPAAPGQPASRSQPVLVSPPTAPSRLASIDRPAPAVSPEQARIYAISRASRVYTDSDAQEAHSYAVGHFSDDVNQHLMAHLPQGVAGADVYIERVQAYTVLASRK